MAKEKESKDEKEELVGLTDDKENKKDYNEVAKDVMNIIEKSPEKDQFKEFAEILASFFDLSIVKFGDETVLNHLENIIFDYRLTRKLYQLGIIKEKK